MDTTLTHPCAKSGGRLGFVGLREMECDGVLSWVKEAVIVGFLPKVKGVAHEWDGCAGHHHNHDARDDAIVHLPTHGRPKNVRIG